MLADHLDELLAGVRVEAGGGDVAFVVVAAGADEGDLGPDDEAGAVAGVVDLLGLGVVGEADGVGAHLAHDFDVAEVLLGGEGGEFALPLLVAADAAEGEVAAVEEEALVGVEADVADAEGLGDGVVADLGGEGVEEGIGDAVPAVGVGDGYGDGDGVGAGGGEGLAGDVEGDGLGLAGGVGEGDGDGEAGLGVGEGVLADADAGGAVVEGADADGVGDDELDAAVEAAEDVEVAGEGEDVGGLGVGDADAELGALAGGGEVGGELVAEGGVTAAVLAEPDVVEHDVGDGAGALEADEDALAFPLGAGLEGEFVDAEGAGVGVVALGVGGVPSVGEGDGLPFGPGEVPAVAEAPAVVEGLGLAGGEGAGGEGAGGEEEGRAGGHGSLRGVVQAKRAMSQASMSSKSWFSPPMAQTKV